MKKNQGSDLSFESLLEQSVYSELARQVQTQRPEVAEAVIRVFVPTHKKYVKALGECFR